MHRGNVWGLSFLIAIVIFYVYISLPSRGGCEVKGLSRIPSGTGHSEAVIKHRICSDGAFTTTVEQSVDLVRSLGDGGAQKVFSMVDYGRDEDGPFVSWPDGQTLVIESRAHQNESITKVGDVTVLIRRIR